MSSDYFLEAHYYSGGLRHRAYALVDSRPEWAPPADSVGFKDEFSLERNTVAIEIKRTEHDGRRLTWLAVYYPSVDNKLGARSNHAGFGVWLDELTIVDSRNLIHGLDLLSRKLAQSVDPDSLETSARDFLSHNFVGAYVAPLDDYPGFKGLRFGREKLADTKLSYLKTADAPGDCPALADHVAGTLFGTKENSGSSRELICVSALDQPSRDRMVFEKIGEDEDFLGGFIRALPAAMRELVDGRKEAENEVATLKSENDALRARMSDYGEMKERLGRFEKDPLSLVLDEIRTLGRKLDSMPSRTEYVRQPIPSSMHFGSGRRNPVTTTTQRRTEEPADDHAGWLFLGLLAFVIVFVVGALIFLLQRYIL